MADFVMPKLGADMTAGTLNAWLKKPGDAVHRGDVVAEVETDKGVIDVEIFSNGVLDKVLVQPGERVPVGSRMATIREEGAMPNAPVAHAPGSPVIAHGAPMERLRISPSARELARKLGVDPSAVQGTGPHGAITREDIEHAAVRTTAPLPAPPPTDHVTRMRQTIAAAMSRSKREIPHYYLGTTIDLHRALAWLAEENQQRDVASRLLPGVLFLKAVALALHDVPELNAVWEGDHVQTSRAIHVGVAITLRQGGLIAPALHHADQRSLDELMHDFRDLVNRARTGSLRSSELADPTITVTSLGEQGVESVFGIITPPQVALVGFGKVVERPWVVEGQVVPRPVVTATLSADHRVSDGHRGGLYLTAIDRLLQEPDKL